MLTKRSNHRITGDALTVILIIPLLVCIIGMLVYALSANPKVCEMGRIAFGCGLLVTLFAFATNGVKLL